MAHWRRICCPVDFSETSRLAMKEALELLGDSQGDLTLVHVVEVSGVVGSEITASPMLVEQIAAETARDLDDWRLEATRSGPVSVVTKVVLGEPAAEIVRFALDWRADLVVIGTHGRTGFKRMILGSVAERVVREAHCPVLVVRPAAHSHQL